jgi:hypothetical protein
MMTWYEMSERRSRREPIEQKIHMLSLSGTPSLVSPRMPTATTPMMPEPVCSACVALSPDTPPRAYIEFCAVAQPTVLKNTTTSVIRYAASRLRSPAPISRSSTGTAIISTPTMNVGTGMRTEKGSRWPYAITMPEVITSVVVEVAGKANSIALVRYVVLK